MNLRSINILAILAALVSIGCAQPAKSPGIPTLPAKAPGTYVEKIHVGGFNRSYILRVPRGYDATKPLPLVILLHGWTSNARAALTITGMGLDCDNRNSVVVAPDGVGSPQGWNSEFINLSGKNVDDVKFIGALMDKVEGEVGIDTNRIYVAGHSNGAFMAHLLASKLSDRIAAIAAVEGTIGVPKGEGKYSRIPAAQGPVSVLIIHGKADRMVQYDSHSDALLHAIGAKDSAAWWAVQDGCGAAPVETKSRDSNVVTDIYSGGRQGSEVELITILNGNHDWPSGSGQSGVVLNPSVDASKMIWDFFEAHPKSQVLH